MTIIRSEQSGETAAIHKLHKASFPTEAQAKLVDALRSAGRWGLLDEYGGGEAFQALELRPGSIPLGAGLVRYAPEFEEFTQA